MSHLREVPIDRALAASNVCSEYVGQHLVDAVEVEFH